jgi:hypothetical protein
MEKFCQLGRLLPRRDGINAAIEDTQSRADLELVLAEMAVVKAEIDAFLNAAKQQHDAACGRAGSAA